jgi:hypothetical protein
LQRYIAESEDKGENDREQVEAQRTHEVGLCTLESNLPITHNL